LRWERDAGEEMLRLLLLVHSMCLKTRKCENISEFSTERFQRVPTLYCWKIIEEKEFYCKATY
jgi:hypothetical protein